MTHDVTSSSPTHVFLYLRATVGDVRGDSHEHDVEKRAQSAIALRLASLRPVLPGRRARVQKHTLVLDPYTMESRAALRGPRTPPLPPHRSTYRFPICRLHT